MKRVVVAGALALASAALTMAPAASATTAAYKNCEYPRVCFYLTDSDWRNSAPSAAYRDVTTSYQSLGTYSRGSNWVLNTRNDDRAYLRYTVNSTGATQYVCLSPGHEIYFSSAYTVTGIRIDTASTC
ncbi:hypothetical protein ABTY20_29000 [Streptomyces sp. NPDC126497]|uniref:hypothetical protein n=1 Tax=unclassified Streptomyces TaxID=2593676 RepID=UPI00331A05B2